MTNTLRDQFGFVPPAVASLPEEARLDGFANRAADLKIPPLLAENYYQTGEQLAARAVVAPASFGITCAIADIIADTTCLRSFITTAGEKFWRRPIEEGEVDKLAQLFASTAAQGEGPAGGVKAVVQALFLSPSSLHRSELGAQQDPGSPSPLTEFEVASALSYTLWDTAPDAELMSLAKQGKLREQATLLSQAKRLMAATERASKAFNHFVEQWMFIENLPTQVKDQALFPEATPEVIQDLIAENRLFVDSVLFAPTGDRSFKTLFTANYGFVSSRTAPIYGIPGITGTQLSRTELNPAERRGLFTLPSFMWAHADSGRTSLVDRGAYFRAQLLCNPVPAPPGGIEQLDPKFAPPDATGREKFTLHSQPACAGCHQLFDSIGFAMESYDAIGRFRTTDHGKPIDTSGAIPLPSGAEVQFGNFVELIDKLAAQPDVYACFATQYLSYASGRKADQLDGCERESIVNRFSGADYKIDELILSIVSSPNFLNRQN